jgi:hypothetical protein
MLNMSNKLFLLFMLVLPLCAYSQSQPPQNPLLMPVMGADKYEYAVLQYKLTGGVRISDVTFSNGLRSEDLKKEYKSAIELYNILGRAGWKFEMEKVKETKNEAEYTVLFSREHPTQNPANSRPANRPQDNNNPWPSQPANQ